MKDIQEIFMLPCSGSTASHHLLWFSVSVFKDNSCSDSPYSSLHSFNKYALNSCSGLGNVLDTQGDMKMNETRAQAKHSPHKETPECGVMWGGGGDAVLIKNWGSVSPMLWCAGMCMTSPVTIATTVTLCHWAYHSTRNWQHQNSISHFGREGTFFGFQ